jgi:hypothetical protein
MHVPGTTVTLLSNPSKMPGHSWSLPALQACPYKVLGDNSICGACYATHGRYTFPNVKGAQLARWEWTKASMRDLGGWAVFTDTLITAIGRTKESFFRIHDAGDFFNRRYTEAWIAIAQALPEKSFWAPTRAWQEKNPWRDALLTLAALPNVTVRPSALFFNAPPPRIPGFAAGSTASDGEYTCPAPDQGNACGSCRTCWSEPQLEVTYRAH